MKIVIDATNGTLGRLASFAAKQALLGKEVAIVNCNDAIVIGRKLMIVNEYRKIRALGGSSMHGPFFPKSPERVVKRTIRGMLSHRQGRGLDAFKRIKCYNETPKELEKEKKITSKRNKITNTIKLSELSKLI